MSWLKKLFGRGNDNEMAAPTEGGSSSPAMDALQSEEERAHIREKMERELEEQRTAASND